MIVMVLWIMVVFLMGCVQVLVRRVALITWRTCQQESLFRPN